MMRAGLFGGDWEDYNDALQNAAEKDFWDSQAQSPDDAGASALASTLTNDPGAGGAPPDHLANDPSTSSGLEYPVVNPPVGATKPGGMAVTPAGYVLHSANGDGVSGPANQASKPFTRLPQPGETEAGESGGAYKTYGTPSGGAGQYGKTKAMQVITSASNALANSPQYTPLSIGNISLENGGIFPGHHGHMDGLNIDIRPARTDQANAPVTWKSPDYDSAATQRIVDAFRATGQVSKIYFNDPNIHGVTPAAEHDNHMHIQLRP